MKLQHPALAEWIPLDMGLTRWAFTNIRYFFPEYPLLWLSDEMEASYEILGLIMEVMLADIDSGFLTNSISNARRKISNESENISANFPLSCQ